MLTYVWLFLGFLSIPNKNSHAEELKDYSSNGGIATQNEDRQVKLKKNVDLFSGIALIVGTMIGKSFMIFNGVIGNIISICI